MLCTRKRKATKAPGFFRNFGQNSITAYVAVYIYNPKTNENIEFLQGKKRGAFVLADK